MLTNLSKILAVATSFIGIAALAVVVASWAGGPNWRGEANEISQYEFTRSDPPNPVWTGKTRRPRAKPGEQPAQVTVAQNVVSLGEAVVKAREDLKKVQDDEIALLDQQTPQIRALITEAQDLNAKDTEAMKLREKLLNDERAKQEEQVDQLSQSATAKAQEVKSIGDEIEKRRNDAARLQNELDNLRADRFRLAEQKKQLEALLVRLQGNSRRLEDRAKQLVEQGAVDPGYDDEKEKKPAEEAKPVDAKPENKDDVKKEEPKKDDEPKSDEKTPE